MGFRVNAYAKVWEVESKSNTWTKLRLSVSKKNKETGEFEQDFNGFVDCLGTAVASKAAALSKGDTIRLGDVDVTNRYDSEKKITYTNYKMFSFENENSTGSTAPTPNRNTDEPEVTVDSGEVEDDRLPF